MCKINKCIEALEPPYFTSKLAGDDDSQISIYINKNDIFSGNPFYVFQKYKYKGSICYSKIYYKLSFNKLSPYRPSAGEPDDQYCVCEPSRNCNQTYISGSVTWLTQKDPKSFNVDLGNNNSILFNLVEK